MITETLRTAVEIFTFQINSQYLALKEGGSVKSEEIYPGHYSKNVVSL